MFLGGGKIIHLFSEKLCLSCGDKSAGAFVRGRLIFFFQTIQYVYLMKNVFLCPVLLLTISVDVLGFFFLSASACFFSTTSRNLSSSHDSIVSKKSTKYNENVIIPRNLI